MPEYTEWLSLEEKTLYVEDCKNIETITIKRDENYNLKFKMTCLFPESLPKPSSPDKIYDAIFNGVTQIKACEYPLLIHKYLIKGIMVESEGFTVDDKLTFSGTAVSIESFWDNNQAGEAEYVVFWAINSSSRLNYDQDIRITGNEYENYKWGDFATDEFHFDKKSTFSWGGVRLQYKAYSFILVKADSFVDGLDRGTLFRFEKKQFPSEKEFNELLQILMYLLGLEFIYIGNTMYNIRSSPVHSTFVSSFKLDIYRIINEIQIPPIPLRLEDGFSKIVNTTELLNNFILQFTQKVDLYQLFDVIGYINYARTQPYNMKIQPLATAFDLLCSHYYKKKSNTLIPAKEFKKISEKVKECILSFTIDGEIVKILISKIANINNQSLNQRNKTIFADLKMNLSKLEEQALNARNTAVHGNSGSSDIRDDIILSNCYFTLINRLVIKLIGSKFYVDYSMKGLYINHVEDKQLGNYSISELA